MSRFISSVRRETKGAHEHVTVFIEGRNVGTLVCGQGEGARLELLLGASPLPPRQAPDEWLIKDFNVLYRVTRDLLRCVGNGDESTTARALNAVAGQLTRLRPAFDLTEGVRLAARETGRIEPPSSDALANYEATKKAGEGN